MKKVILFLTLAVLLVSCADDLSELNENEKDPAQVDGEDLFASAEKRLADIIITPSKAKNNTRLWVQYWQETTYPEESRYFNISRGVSDTYWEILYTEVLKNLEEAYTVVDETDQELTNAQKPNKKAVIEILKVYAFANLVETYGDILYEEALDIDNTLPEYSDGKKVYLDLIERLDKAVESFTADGGFSKAEDLIYGGATEQWKIFAQTLKLRMGINLADTDPERAKKIVEEAYREGVMANNEDDALYHYPGDVPNNNPINTTLVVSGRNDFVVGRTLTDKMNTLKDPRRAFYFDPHLSNPLGVVQQVDQGAVVLSDFTNEAEPGSGVYVKNGDEAPTYVGYIKTIEGNTVNIDYPDEWPQVGDQLIYAQYTGGEIGVKSSYSKNSHLNSSIKKPDFPGTLLSYVETEFLLAEAAERGFAVGQSAQQHYDKGIRASFKKWGVPHVEKYLAKEEVDYTKAKAKSNANPAWKAVIGTQAWLALYNRTFASWLSVRRLDYPVLTAPERRDSSFPLRFSYPISEQNLNGPNQQKAAEHIGGDKVETALFWDQVDAQDLWDW